MMRLPKAGIAAAAILEQHLVGVARGHHHQDRRHDVGHVDRQDRASPPAISWRVKVKPGRQDVLEPEDRCVIVPPAQPPRRSPPMAPTCRPPPQRPRRSCRRG